MRSDSPSAVRGESRPGGLSYGTLAGACPPRYGNRRVSWLQNGPLPRRARACPSPCCGLSNTSFRTVTVGFLGCRTAPPHRRARACPSPCCGLSNTSFRTVTVGFLGRGTAPFPVGRGPVPRHVSVYQIPLLGRYPAGFLAAARPPSP